MKPFRAPAAAPSRTAGALNGFITLRLMSFLATLGTMANVVGGLAIIVQPTPHNLQSVLRTLLNNQVFVPLTIVYPLVLTIEWWHSSGDTPGWRLPSVRWVKRTECTIRRPEHGRH